MAKDTYSLEHCQRFYDFPLNIRSVARRYANSFRHKENKLLLIHLCFVLSEEEDEVLELDGVKRYDSNPPFMRVTYPGTIAHHLHSSVRNELFFTYESSYLETFRKFGFSDCNFKMTDCFKVLLDKAEKLLSVCHSPGVADRLDRLAVMLGMEAMLSALEPSEDPVRNGSERIGQVEKYFQFHFAENFDLEELLGKFGMSLRTFYREWKAAFPISPAQYLLNLRMQKACRLLREPDLRIYEVANACGYCNELYFCRVFVKAHGLTPLAYRRACLKK